MRTRPERFVLTEQHVALLRHSYVSWWPACDLGAPAIDPKRPYGNSDVVRDIATVLDVPRSATVDGVPVWDDAVTARLRSLHETTDTALQIVLATGSFEPGEYVCTRSCDSLSWKRTRPAG